MKTDLNLINIGKFQFFEINVYMAADYVRKRPTVLEK